MTKIKNITVIMQDGGDLGSTYPKRAEHLVRKQRAVWVDDTTIRMTEQRKDSMMAEQEMKNDIQKELENAKTLDLATKRVEEKNRLIINCLDFVLLVVVLFFIIFVYRSYWVGRAFVAALYGAFMLLRLVRKLWLHNRASSTKSIRAYLADRKEREIRIAYERLLEMREQEDSVPIVK